MNATRTASVKLAFSVVLLLTIIYLAYQHRAVLTDTAKNTNLSWVFTGLLCYIFNYAARAHRITLLCHKALNVFPQAMKITLLHGFLSYILPMRAGDFTLPFLLRSLANVPLTQGNAIFIQTRLADFFGLGVLLLASTLAPNSIQNEYFQILFFCTGIILCILPFLGMQLLNLEAVKDFWIFQKIFGTELGSRITLMEGLLSINIWFWTGCTSFCVIKAIGLPLTPFDAWFLAAIQLPLQLLPIQGLANSGTHEAGWVMGLTLLGIPSDQTFTAAVATHILLVSYVCILGAVAAVLPGKSNEIS